MIGQMIMTGFKGRYVGFDSLIIKDIKENNLGAVVLFDEYFAIDSFNNIQSPQQLKKLTADLQNLASIPLLIAIDQEGGKICRLKQRYGFPKTETANYIGKINGSKTVYRYADHMASVLSSVGINVNLAPVADVSDRQRNSVMSKEKRCFSNDPSIVANHSLAFISAHHKNKVFCTLKHFPGQGNALHDTHNGFVDISNTWSISEMHPFEKIIQKGYKDIIMIGHLFNDKLDPLYPATLSKIVLTDILRNQLNFNGIILTDDILMRALEDEFGFEKSVVASINAGADMLMITNVNWSRVKSLTWVIDLIHRMVEQDKIPRQRIIESFNRIVELKKRIISFN